MKVDWVDDWPVFNEGRNITLLTRGRDSSVERVDPGDVPLEWQANLEGPNLELGWYQKSEWSSNAIPCQWHKLTIIPSTDTPLKQSYSLTERPGYLRLWGNCYDLSSPEAPAMLLRKQTSFYQTFEVTMEFGSQQIGAEAGLVLWWSQFSYATVGVRFVATPGDSRRPRILCRTPEGRPGEFHVRLPWTSLWNTCSDANMSIAQTTSAYLSDSVATTPSTIVPVRLTLVCEGSTAHVSCSAEDLTIMPPVGGAFTGVMFGVYAFGRGEPVLDPADFTDIRVLTRES